MQLHRLEDKESRSRDTALYISSDALDLLDMRNPF